MVIRVGPAGWSYPDWEGKVYPVVKPAGFHPLRYVAQFFDCVEINSTFYAVPRAEHATRWSKLIEPRADFRMVVKLNRDFTHEPESPEDPWDAKAVAFVRGIEPLRRTKKIATLLVQFPATFLYGKDEVRRLGRLRSLFPGFSLVLEVRHHSWYSPPALDTIRGLSYSLAHTDLPAAWNHPPEWHVSTGPIGYLRLHGRNSKSWFRRGVGRDEKYDYLYSTVELEGLVQKARRLGDEHDEVIVIANNHFAGQAFANAIEFLALLRNEAVPAPPEIVEAYPHLRPIVHIEGQQRLF